MYSVIVSLDFLPRLCRHIFNMGGGQPEPQDPSDDPEVGVQAEEDLIEQAFQEQPRPAETLLRDGVQAIGAVVAMLNEFVDDDSDPGGNIAIRRFYNRALIMQNDMCSVIMKRSKRRIRKKRWALYQDLAKETNRTPSEDEKLEEHKTRLMAGLRKDRRFKIRRSKKVVKKERGEEVSSSNDDDEHLYICQQSDATSSESPSEDEEYSKPILEKKYDDSHGGAGGVMAV